MPNNTISKPVDSPVLDAQARALFAFLTSAEARPVWERFGFRVAQ